MKTVALSLMIAVLLGMASPPSAWSAGPGGGMGGHVGGFRGGAFGDLDPVGRVDPGSAGGPLDHPGRIDRDDRAEHGGMLGVRDHINEPFGYPVCSAYAYCPSPVSPCAWEGAGPPSVDDDSAETAYGDWVPPGCD